MDGHSVVTNGLRTVRVQQEYEHEKREKFKKELLHAFSARRETDKEQQDDIFGYEVDPIKAADVRSEVSSTEVHVKEEDIPIDTHTVGARSTYVKARRKSQRPEFSDGSKMEVVDLTSDTESTGN